MMKIIAPNNNTVKKLPVKWLAAASIIIIAGLTWFTFQNQQINSLSNLPSQNDSSYIILPGTKRAMLWTGNNKKLIDLNDPGSSRIINDGDHQADNNNSVLTYFNGNKPEWHRLTTPRGGEYKLVLADGTIVWLNAESSLYYPTGFTGNKRRVQLTGEAYFEVSADKTKPFEVQAGTMLVKVTGTHFNVNDYAKTNKFVSLLEGKVSVAENKEENNLLPGQQATINSKGKIMISSPENIQRSIAWTKGRFSFDRTSLQVVLEELERWYNVEFDISKITKQQEFTGDVQRNSSLQEVLRMLQLSTGNQFTIHGKLIRVTP